MGSSLISWKTKKQSTGSRSTVEVEYCSMCTTAYELKWISFLLTDFQLLVNQPITLHCDNEAVVAIAKNLVFHEHTKHIDIDCHIVRNMVVDGFLNGQ